MDKQPLSAQKGASFSDFFAETSFGLHWVYPFEQMDMIDGSVVAPGCKNLRRLSGKGSFPNVDASVFMFLFLYECITTKQSNMMTQIMKPHFYNVPSRSLNIIWQTPNPWRRSFSKANTTCKKANHSKTLLAPPNQKS